MIDSINYDMLSYQSSLLISFQPPLPLFVSFLQHNGFYHSSNDFSIFFWKAYLF